jgi:uncharacterized membrane protein
MRNKLLYVFLLLLSSRLYPFNSNALDAGLYLVGIIIVAILIIIVVFINVLILYLSKKKIGENEKQKQKMISKGKRVKIFAIIPLPLYFFSVFISYFSMNQAMPSFGFMILTLFVCMIFIFLSIRILYKQGKSIIDYNL